MGKMRNQAMRDAAKQLLTRPISNVLVQHKGFSTIHP